MVFFFFFFFKQKTAYEMRISDWSSDVCSSDLHRRQRPRPDAAQRRDRRPAGSERRRQVDDDENADRQSRAERRHRQNQGGLAARTAETGEEPPRLSARAAAGLAGIDSRRIPALLRRPDRKSVWEGQRES